VAMTLQVNKKNLRVKLWVFVQVGFGQVEHNPLDDPIIYIYINVLKFSTDADRKGSPIEYLNFLFDLSVGIS
jgi:hypothetical protein